MLDPYSRGAILALTAVCVVAAIELAPIPVRSFYDQTELRPARPVDAPTADAVGIVAIRRDPFAVPVPSKAPAASAVASVAAPSARVLRGTLETLPSNLIGDTIPALPGTPARITAIVTGAHPFALVESGGDHQIKGIGDRVDGIPIVAIDIDGIRLQNGGHLAVDPAGHP